MTAGPRTNLSWKLGCHVGMAWWCQILLWLEPKRLRQQLCWWNSDSGRVMGDWLTDCRLYVSADLCASISTAYWTLGNYCGVLKWYSSMQERSKFKRSLETGTYYRKMCPQPFEAHAGVIDSAVRLVMNTPNVSTNLRQQSWHILWHRSICRDTLC